MDIQDAFKCESIPEDVKEQLRIIETSKKNILLIIAGVLLSYHNINLQENQLICSALTGEACECPELVPLRFTSSTIILIALAYFYCLSKQTLDNTGGEDCSAKYNYIASLLTLLAVIIRYADLLKSS